MKRSTSLLDMIINRNKPNNLNNIKAELKIEKNISLIRFLMNYFISKLVVVDYSTDIKEYSDMIRSLNFIKPENDEEFKIVEDYIKEMRKIISDKEETLSFNQEALSLLEMLEEKIGVFIVETHFEMMARKEKIKSFPSVEDEKLKAIICDYIFKYKDYGHLNLLISLYPNACNIKSNDKTIVIKIIKNYFIKLTERGFLSKVITLFISNPNFKISDDEKKEIAILCEQYSSVLNMNDLIFVKEIITSLGINQEINMDQKLNILKIRFGINDLNFDDISLSHESFPVDMTDRVAMTIDCSDTLIRDDAFSIRRENDGTFELGLYITDLSMIKSGSSLDNYAHNHFSTIYTKDNWVPMFPEPLVYTFSLNTGFRRVIAHIFRFTPKMELIDCEIVPAIINVRNNLSYSETTGILNDGGELSEFLKDALNISEVINDSLSSIDKYHHIKEIFRELGGYSILEKYLDTPGNRIISTFSIFLNYYLAKSFAKTSLPFIYRVNDFEVHTNIQLQLKKYQRDKVICNMLKALQTSYKPSFFSSINSGHKGLGLDSYTQATNPARLYPSLMLQRMISDLFISKIPVEEYVEKYKNVEKFAQEFNELQQRNYNFTNEYNKLCRHLTIEKNK